MSAISSSTGTQSAAQAGLGQLQLQQARQNAARAEQTARALRAEAASAQQVANNAQENARALSVRSEQAQSEAGQARQGVTVIESAGQMQTQLGNVASRIVVAAERDQSTQPAETSTTAQTANVPNAPVVNTQGQVTGTVVNTTA